MKEKEIKVLKVKPHEHPEVYMLKNTLEAMQEAVGGYIASQVLFARKNVKKQKNGKTAKNEGNAGISRIVGRLKKGIDIFCEP